MQAFLTDLLGLQPEKVQRIFTIIRAGMGTADTLTGEAVSRVGKGGGGVRDKTACGTVVQGGGCAFSELAERAIQCTEKHISLLVSGDVGCFSAAGSCANGSCRTASNARAGIVQYAVYVREMRYFLRKSVLKRVCTVAQEIFSVP